MLTRNNVHPSAGHLGQSVTQYTLVHACCSPVCKTLSSFVRHCVLFEYIYSFPVLTIPLHTCCSFPLFAGCVFYRESDFVRSSGGFCRFCALCEAISLYPSRLSGHLLSVHIALRPSSPRLSCNVRVLSITL